MSSKYLLATFGTVGDVKPFLTIAKRLFALGHVVTLATEKAHESLVLSSGFRWKELAEATERERLDAMQQVMQISSLDERTMALTDLWFTPYRQQIHSRLTDMSAGFDVLVVNQFLFFALEEILAKRSSATGFCIFLGPCLRVPALERLYRSARSTPVIAVSAHLFSGPNYAGRLAARGFLIDRQKPTAVVREGEEIDVLITVGSIRTFDEHTLLTFLEETAAHCGRRIGVQGVSAQSILDGTWEWLDYVAPQPHESLFPRTRCILTHGGSGTVATALSCGKPLVFLPQISEQWSTAKACFKAGVSPGMVLPGLQYPFICGELIHQALTDSSFRLRAEEMQRRMLEEDGTAQIVRMLTCPTSLRVADSDLNI